MQFLLDITKEDYGEKVIEKFGLGETALFGVKMLGIGIVIVFSVLALLWLFLVLFRVFFHDLPAKRKEKPAKVSLPAPEAAKVASSQDEIIAVLAAAVAMAEEESGGMKFRVVSFRRK